MTRFVFVAAAILALSRPAWAWLSADVAATVNGVPIRTAEYEKELQTAFDYWQEKYPAELKKPEEAAKIKQSTLEELVNRELLAQEASARGLKAKEADVDAGVSQIKSRFKSEAEFQQELTSQGLTEKAFRSRLAKQVAVRKLIDQEVRAKLGGASAEEVQKGIEQYIVGLKAKAIVQRNYALIGDVAAGPALAPVVEQKRPAAPTPSDLDTPKFSAKPRPSDFALVIGIEKYKSLPKADYAARDAEAMKRYLVAMGYPERNVVLLEGEDATKSKIQAYVEEWLPKNTKPESTIFLYYSGHGAPDAATKQAYLVPSDGDPMFLKTTAYPLRSLYSSLNALPAKRVIVALDSCFSGAGGRSVLAKGARPLVTEVSPSAGSGKIVILAAASGEQISGTYDEKGHGLFTYYLLRGLGGDAKRTAGVLSAKALYDYMKPLVADEAHRQNREQTPVLVGDEALLKP